MFGKNRLFHLTRPNGGATSTMSLRDVQVVQLLLDRGTNTMILRLAADPSDNDDENDKPSPSSLSTAENLQGLGNYLVPYLLTAVAALVVTGLFVQFVLLDY